MSDLEESFYNQLQLSNRTKVNYRSALKGSFIKGVLRKKYDTDDIFTIVDLPRLWEVYSYINHHECNRKNHRIYSAAIMRYMRFLNNGVKYRDRINTIKTE